MKLEQNTPHKSDNPKCFIRSSWLRQHRRGSFHYYLFQGELLGDGVVLQLLDLLHQLVDLKLLLLLQVLLQFGLLVLELQKYKEKIR